MIDTGVVAAGAIGNILAEQLQEKTKKITQEDILQDILATLSDIFHVLQKQPEIATDEYELLTIYSSGPSIIRSKNRAHYLIFYPYTYPLDIKIPGLPVFQMTLQFGWNVLDFPDETEIMLDSSVGLSSITMLVRHTNERVF